MFSFPTGSPAALHGMHLLGTGDTNLAQLESLVKVSMQTFLQVTKSNSPCPQEGEKYALVIYTALNAKLKDEELRRTEKARRKFSAAR